MKHALIIAHPKPQSFTRSAAGAYAEELRRLGHDVIVRDLYAMGFDPAMKAEEIPGPSPARPGDDVTAERDILAACGAYTLAFPLWLSGMPAMMKGYLDRVFGHGFAFESGPQGPVGKLKGKKLLILSSSGAPTDWLIRSGTWEAIRVLQDDYLAQLSGLTLAGHVHFGYVVPNMTKAMADKHLDAARQAARSHFGAQA